MAFENDFNELERALLNWLKTRHNNKHLSAQIDAAVFRQREWTKVGFYTSFDVSRELAPIDLKDFGGGWPIDGPGLQSDDIEFGGGTLFWGTDGFLDCIEMFANGSYFHEQVKKFELLAYEKP